MTEQEAIEVIKANFPKTCRMVEGRYAVIRDDTECDFGKALLLSVHALEKIGQYREFDDKLQMETGITVKELHEKWNAMLSEYLEYRQLGTV